MAKELPYLESSGNAELLEEKGAEKKFVKNMSYTFALTWPFAILYSLGLFELLAMAVYTVIKNGEARRQSRKGLLEDRAKGSGMLAYYSIKDFL